MHITTTSKSTFRVEYNGRVAHFVGDLGSNSFRAIASSMTWLLPHAVKVAPTEEERLEVMRAVVAHTIGTPEYKFFVDDEGNELMFDIQAPVGRRAKRKGILKRLFG